MAVILPNSCFLHIPKTGGSTIRNALLNAGLYDPRLGDKETGVKGITTPHEYRAHMRLKEVREYSSSKYLFTFVRDPVDWYTSIYAFRRENKKWPMLDIEDNDIAYIDGLSIDEWLKSLFTLGSNYALRYFQLYIGGIISLNDPYMSYIDSINYIGFTHKLLPGLVDVLTLYENITRDQCQAILDTPSSNKAPTLYIMHKDTRELVHDQEWEFYSKFKDHVLV